MSDPDTPFYDPDRRGNTYSRAGMIGAHFDGVTLAEAQFFAVLTMARFSDTDLQGADFDDMNLSQSRFKTVTFADSTITNANLSGLSISGVTLAQADIKKADLTGMRINGILVSELLAAYEAANP